MHKIAKSTARKPVSGEVLIPDKLYFRIGEVSRLCGLPSYVLRFWETEFSQLKPSKSGTGQRMYRKIDVENVLQVKKLLYDQGFTIAGASQQITGGSEAQTVPATLCCPRDGQGRAEAGPPGTKRDPRNP